MFIVFIIMEHERPFVITRVAKPGSSISKAPLVVSCNWTELKMENVFTFTCKSEDLLMVAGCPVHRLCKGHHMMDQNRTAYMIPFGFATGDELRYSDAAAINASVCSGDKGAIDVANYCFDRIRGKNGVLRKKLNSTRPSNTMRFVASPLDPPRCMTSAEQKGTVYVPNEIFDRAKFLFMTEDGMFETVTIKEGDMVALGRCPSQGDKSALPMVVRRVTKNEDSIRIPLDLCKMNNADFDGDELWMQYPASRDAIEELKSAWHRVWVEDGGEGVVSKLDRIICEAGGDNTVDPAIYTTMPLEDMVDHMGGDMYDTLMLKPRSWKVMGQTTFSRTYWKSWVDRSLNGIVNSTMGKHGIGKPYVHMRNAMMMGTMVVKDGNFIRIRARHQPPLPVVAAPSKMHSGSCSSALTKMTASLYQREIDMAKHGKETSRLTAVETIMKSTEVCFAFVHDDTGLKIRMMSIMDAVRTGHPYTKMSYISQATSPKDILERAIMVVSMVEELDAVHLTDEERLSVAIFFAYASRKTDVIVDDDTVTIMRALGADWYTSITCSNIVWLKYELRKGVIDGSVDTSTDISSFLGALALGNMTMFAPFASSGLRSRSTLGHEDDHLRV